MLSNDSPLLAAPRPGQALLCLWVAHGRDLATIALKLLTLAHAPACGAVEKFGRQLVVIWPDHETQRAICRIVLVGQGDLIDWPGTIPLNATWQPWHGQPHLVADEHEGAADIPAWLARIQAEVSV